MPYFTTWDVNVFLCLLTLGLPYDLVKDMTKFTKKVKDKFIEDETRDWYCSISPSLLYKKHKIGQWHFSVLAKTNSKYIGELKLSWKWRCPEVRRDLIYRIITFQNIQDIDRLKHDFDPLNGRYRIDSDKDRPKKGRYHSSEGLWDVWSAWGEYNDPVRLSSKDCDVCMDDICSTHPPYTRRNFIANWYNNIHEGRYFLFFKENNLTGYGRRKSKDIKLSEKVGRFGSIHSIGPYQQMAEDLLVLDGPGLGKSGSKVEHIDDLFSK